MEVKYEKKNAMTLIGFYTRIRPEDGYRQCPDFWEKEYQVRFQHLWQTGEAENALEKAMLDNQIGHFAICEDRAGESYYWIAGEYQGGEVPEGLELFAFPDSDWAVFTTQGPLPGSLQQLNMEIWNDWFPAKGSKLMPNGTATLEVYSYGDPTSPGYECGIWLPYVDPAKEPDAQA